MNTALSGFIISPRKIKLKDPSTLVSINLKYIMMDGEKFRIFLISIRDRDFSNIICAKLN